MIHNDVKQAVESGDISSLKYLFCDSLDGDPTFSAYEDDYEYCKSKGIPFVPHSEINPMTLNAVNDEYWIQLKKDFMKNPSIERMEHMREVAKIFYSERIRKINEEKARKIAQQSAHTPAPQPKPPVSAPVVQPENQSVAPVNKPTGTNNDIYRTSGTGNTSGDGIRRVSEPVRHSGDGIRRVSEPVRNSGDGIRRVSEPVRHSGDGIRRTSEPVRYSDDGIRRTSEPVRKNTQSSKKSQGVDPKIVAIAIVIIVIILIVISQK